MLKVLKLQLKGVFEVLKSVKPKVIGSLGSLKNVKPNGKEVLNVCLRSGRC